MRAAAALGRVDERAVASAPMPEIEFAAPELLALLALVPLAALVYLAAQ
ncbi:MAG: hypothetical protein GXY03_10800, partial [Solirubrobacterales bacterium]|nr:hypothetical protein [Solirubrobacterales bacterium]